jgi:hypothetical protein
VLVILRQWGDQTWGMAALETGVVCLLDLTCTHLSVAIVDDDFVKKYVRDVKDTICHWIITMLKEKIVVDSRLCRIVYLALL